MCTRHSFTITLATVLALAAACAPLPAVTPNGRVWTPPPVADPHPGPDWSPPRPAVSQRGPLDETATSLSTLSRICSGSRLSGLGIAIIGDSGSN
jgi:hypothetical protein